MTEDQRLSGEAGDPGSARLLVMVPSRGRPENIVRLEEARKRTAATKNVDFIYVVDHDDPKVMDYMRLGYSRTWFLHQRRRLGPTLNFVAEAEWGNYAYLGFMGDDHLPQTEGWDVEVLEALGQGGPRVVYGNDLLQREALPTAVFMPSRVVEAAGFFCPPDQIHLYLDNYWLMLGDTLGTLVYLPDVVIEHIHPIAKGADGQQKAPWDEGYAEVNSPSLDVADRGAWMRFIEDGRFQAAVDRIKKEYAR